MTRAELRTAARQFAQQGNDESLLAFPVDEWPSERVDPGSFYIGYGGEIHKPVLTGGVE